MNTEYATSLLGRLESDAQVQKVLGPVLGDPDPINDPSIDYAIAANAYLRISKGYLLMVMETHALPDRAYEEDVGYVNVLWITRDNIQSDGVRLELPADLHWDLGAEELSQIASRAMRSSMPEVSPCWHAIAYRGFELVIKYTIVDEIIKVEEVAVALPCDWKKIEEKFAPP